MTSTGFAKIVMAVRAQETVGEMRRRENACSAALEDVRSAQTAFSNADPTAKIACLEKLKSREGALLRAMRSVLEAQRGVLVDNLPLEECHTLAFSVKWPQYTAPELPASAASPAPPPVLPQDERKEPAPLPECSFDSDEEGDSDGESVVLLVATPVGSVHDEIEPVGSDVESDMGTGPGTAVQDPALEMEDEWTGGHGVPTDVGSEDFSYEHAQVEESQPVDPEDSEDSEYHVQEDSQMTYESVAAQDPGAWDTFGYD